MAVAGAVTVTFPGGSLFSRSRRLSAIDSSSLSSSNANFSPLRQINNSPSSNLVARYGSINSRKLAQRFDVPEDEASPFEFKDMSHGRILPRFKFREPLTGKKWMREDFESHPALLMMFLGVNCPYSQHLKKDIARLTSFYMKKGLAVVAMSSNCSILAPEEGPKFIAEDAKKHEFPFPYLWCGYARFLRHMGVQSTPEFILFKKNLRGKFEAVYHGRYDDSLPDNDVPVTGRDLSHAIDCVLSGRAAPLIQHSSVGSKLRIPGQHEVWKRELRAKIASLKKRKKTKKKKKTAPPVDEPGDDTSSPKKKKNTAPAVDMDSPW